MLIFLLGILLGVAAGCLVCVRYLRHEIAADIGPRLQRLQHQLDNLEMAINLAMVTRYADLTTRPPHDQPTVIPSSASPPRPRQPDWL